MSHFSKRLPPVLRQQIEINTFLSGRPAPDFMQPSYASAQTAASTPDEPELPVHTPAPVAVLASPEPAERQEPAQDYWNDCNDDDEAALMHDNRFTKWLVNDSNHIRYGRLAKVFALSVAMGLVSLLGLSYWWNATPVQPETVGPQSQLALAAPAVSDGALIREDDGVAEDKRLDVFNFLGLAPDGKAPMPDGKMPAADAAPMSSSLATVAVGRPDPFEPLLDAYRPSGVQTEQERDVLEDVQFTGFINDVGSSQKVAILKVTEPGGSTQTFIKRVNQSLTVEGKPLVIKNIKNNTLYVTLAGKSRTLTLSPFSVAMADAGVAQAASPSASALPPAMPNGGAAPPAANPPARVGLQEP